MLQSVSCVDWQEVPANFVPPAPLDDTGGHYVQWGPVDAAIVHPVDRDGLPAGCELVDGVAFRVSGTPFGNGLGFDPAAGSPGPYPAEATAVLPGTTGDSGVGTLRTPVGELSAPQRESLVNGVGLWVEALDLPGDFANLRCHADRYHADNLEVIRAGSTDVQVACVLYVVNRTVLPPSTQPTTPLPVPVTPTVPVAPELPLQPLTPSPPVGSAGVESPTPSVAGTPTPVDPATTAVALGESGLTGQPATSSPVGGVAAAGVDPLAAARFGELQVRLTVRKVGVGPLADAWAEPTVVVSYECADQRRQLRVERGPATALSAVLPLPVGTVCRLSVDGPAAIGDLRPSISIDTVAVAAGQPFLVSLTAGTPQRMVDVLVDLPGPDGNERRAPMAAEPGTTIDAELASGPVEIVRTRLTATTAVGLGMVFLAGLGLSVVAARRPL